MDGDKVREVLAIYRRKFEKMGVPKQKFSAVQLPVTPSVLAHCHAMLDEVEIFIQEGRVEKAMRWLGFIQGCLWSQGMYNLEDLKNQNRPVE